LFSSKRFVDKVTYAKDAGVKAGVFAYKDLKIKWTLDFRATGHA